MTWFVGAVINIIGSILINGSQNCMKLGHIHSEKSDEGKVCGKSKIWLGGCVTFAIGNVMNFASLSLAAQSLLASLGSVQFLANVLFGCLILHVPPTRRVLLGTATIVAGNVLIVIVCSKSSSEYSVDQLQELYTETSYLCYVGFLAALWTALLATQEYKRAHRPEEATSNQMGFLYAGISAIIGHNGVTLMKSVSEILASLQDPQEGIMIGIVMLTAELEC